MERTSPVRRLADALTALAFTAAVATPALLWAATGEVDRSLERERRVLQPRPALADFDHFRAAFPDWYDDTFRLRGALVRGHSLLKLFVFGVSPSSNMIVGEDGWMFFAGEGVLDSARGLDPFGADELEHWREVLEARRDWLAARDAEFLFVVAPDKPSIYPGQLPPAYRVPGVRTRLDQLAAFLPERSDVRFVDPRPALRAEAERRGIEAPLYFPHGTHWNDRGALVAYREMLAALPASLGLGPAWSAEDFGEVDQGLVTEDWVGDTWAEQLLVEDVVRQEAMVYQPLPGKPRRARMAEYHQGPAGLMDGAVEQAGSSLPRVLLFRDSFGDWLWYFLAEHASRLAVDSAAHFDPELVDREGPDLVIWELVERRLWELYPGADVPADEVALARRWLAAEPVTLVAEEGHSAGSLAEPGRALVRLRLAEGVAGTLRWRWWDGSGEAHEEAREVGADPGWMFLEAGPAVARFEVGPLAPELAARVSQLHARHLR